MRAMRTTVWMGPVLVAAAAVCGGLAMTVDVHGSDELRPERLVARAAAAVKPPADCSAYTLEYSRVRVTNLQREIRATTHRGEFLEVLERQLAEHRATLFMCGVAPAE